MLVQNFYNRFMGNTQTLVDTASGRAFMRKSVNDAYELMEEMALDDQQWPNARNVIRRVVGVNENNVISKLTTHMEMLTRKLEGSSLHAPINQINQYCEHCGGQHGFEMCSFVDVNSLPMEQAQVVCSFLRPNNPYSNSYNPGLRNHPNF